MATVCTLYPTVPRQLPEGPVKPNAKNPDGSTVIVMDLSFKSVDFGRTFLYTFSYFFRK
jgi:hypothetical protein